MFCRPLFRHDTITHKDFCHWICWCISCKNMSQLWSVTIFIASNNIVNKNKQTKNPVQHTMALIRPTTDQLHLSVLGTIKQKYIWETSSYASSFTSTDMFFVAFVLFVCFRKTTTKRSGWGWATRSINLNWAQLFIWFTTAMKAVILETRSSMLILSNTRRSSPQLIRTLDNVRL